VREGRGGKGGETDTAAAVSDDEHEPALATAVLAAFLVQRRQAGAVLLDAVGERPVVDELQPRRDQKANFLG